MPAIFSGKPESMLSRPGWTLHRTCPETDPPKCALSLVSDVLSGNGNLHVQSHATLRHQWIRQCTHWNAR